LNVIAKTYIKIWNYTGIILEYLSNMQQQQSNPLVSSAQNKELLWSTLQESGAFTGLSRDQFEPVKLAFDRAVQQASRSISSLSSLNDANKQIIRQFVQTELPAIRSSTNPVSLVASAPKKKKIEMVYRAEDLQSERANDFERQLREKQAEMDSFLTLKKPTDVSFTDKDKGVLEDKPIGDEMSRLIANELAARERELVQLKPEDIKKAQQWIGTNGNAAIKTEIPSPLSKKSVSFSETIEDGFSGAEDEIESNDANAFGEKFEETESIFSKFKRISAATVSAATVSAATVSAATVSAATVSAETTATATVTAAATITMQQIYDKMIALEERMAANHAEIMAHFSP
jgi:hypothetical protein